MTVNKLKRVDGTRFRHPERGDVFLLVTLTVRNQGPEIQDPGPTFAFDFSEEMGQQYFLDLIALTETNGTPVDAGQRILPDEQLRVELGFIGSQGTTEISALQLTFDPDPLATSDSVVIELGP